MWLVLLSLKISQELKTWKLAKQRTDIMCRQEFICGVVAVMSKILQRYFYKNVNRKYAKQAE